MYWNTTSSLLQSTLRSLMACELFDAFRLVGGTSLALQLGHRISVDIDLFSDVLYGSIDFDELDAYLKEHYTYFSSSIPGPAAMGKQYFIGKNETEAVKLDLYYTDGFIRPLLIKDGIRMATVDEIIAMKIDVIQRGGRKKDFWDLHELMDAYSFETMLKLHEERYPYTHDQNLILQKLIDFSNADDDFEPQCLKGKYWEIIKLDIIEALE